MIERAKSGDRQALENLLYESYPLVFGYLVKMCRDEELAKDITQEVMVKAIVNVGQFRGNSKFSTWLVSMAVNLYKDSLRKKKSVPLDFDDSFHDGSSESAESVTIRQESSTEIYRLIEDLPDAQREVFLLKHYYGLTYEEIAKAVKCPVGTVRSRLHNGINKLKEKIVREE